MYMNVIFLNDYAYENGGASVVVFWLVRQLSANSNINICVYAGTGEFDQEIVALPRVRTYSLRQFDLLRDPNRFRAMRNGLWNREAAARLDNFLC